MNIKGIFCSDHLGVINQGVSDGVIRGGGLLSSQWAFYCKRCNRYLLADMDGCGGLNNYLMNEKQIIQYKKMVKKQGFVLPEVQKIQKKGGRMPKIFKYAFWLMMLMLVWKFVTHVDQIILFFLKGGI